MSLLTYRAPVDYESQITAFKDFLENYKSFDTATEASDAIGNLNLGEDGLSDEYDFMDDAVDGDPQAATRSRRRGEAKRKYMTVLQDVADRKKAEITIDLDDLDEVRLTCMRWPRRD